MKKTSHEESVSVLIDYLNDGGREHDDYMNNMIEAGRNPLDIESNSDHIFHHYVNLLLDGDFERWRVSNWQDDWLDDDLRNDYLEKNEAFREKYPNLRPNKTRP